MEIRPLQTFLAVTRPQGQASGSVSAPAADQKAQSIKVDTSTIWLMPGSPEDYTEEEKLKLYNKAGVKQVLYVRLVNPYDWQPDYHSVLEKGLDPQAYPQKITDNQSVVPAGGETMADETKQLVSEQDAQSANLATPIADSLNISLFAPSSSGNLTILSADDALTTDWNLTNDNPNLLAEAVVAYDKTQTEIEQTYSDQAITQRAAATGITNLTAYEQTQDQARDAEKSAAEQKFENEVEAGIGSYVTDLYQFFDPSQTNAGGGFDFRAEQLIENSTFQQTQDDMANLTLELNKLYAQYKQTNSVDYSKESVGEVAAQFNAAVLNQAQTTVDISGTDFTYKDLYVSHSVLRAIGNNDQSLSDPFPAALGQSGINYLAQNEMTSGAAAMLKKGYAASLDQAITQLNDLVYGEDQPSTPDRAFQMLGNLDTSSAAAFSSGFSQAFSQLEDEYASLGNLNQSGINHSNAAQTELGKVQDLYNVLQTVFNEAG
ncbi:hypothetical protein [Sporolactobacillus sp. KGMB 08714]|uniref:hypothetical protein n=1 Tax=Sporolactobacillus sp. KGMB 08714 TaxID=3064704 RepID=UPI002FBED2E7